MSNVNNSIGLKLILAVLVVLVALLWRPGTQAGRKVDIAAFEASLTDGDLVLVKFGAPWCPPCRKIEGELDKLDTEKLQVKIIKVDVDQQPQLSSKYGISSIPHLMLVRGGKTVDEQRGYRSQGQLEEWIRSHR